MAKADGETQYRLLIERCIEDAAIAERALQPGRCAVNTALAPYILAKDDCPGICIENATQRQRYEA